MGMRACYMEVNEDQLQQLLDNDNLLEDIEELSDEEEHNEIDIDKMWDVLHFLLTGISATEPIEDDPLSELIAGEIVADEEDFIAYTTPQKVQELAGVMSEINKEFLPRSRRTRTCRPGFNLLTVRLFRIIISSIASFAHHMRR